MLLQHLSYACRKWWPLILGTMLLGGGCAWWSSGALRPALFKATASVLVTLESHDRLTQLPNPQLKSDLQVPKFMATQMSIAMSERVAQEALQALAGRQPGAPRSAEERQAEKALAEWLVQTVEVENPAQSGVLHISFMHTDPAAAAAIANALAMAYIHVTQQVNFEIAGAHSRLYEEKVRKAREAYASAMQVLAEYQQRTGLLDVGEAGTQWLTTRYWTKQQMLDRDRAGLAAQRADQLRDPLSVPDLEAQTSTAAELIIELANARSKLAELESQLGTEHPSTAAQRQQVAQLEAAERQVSAELARSHRATAITTDGAARSVDALTASQTGDLAEDRDVRARAVALIQNVDSAAKEFEQAYAMREWALLNQTSKLVSAQVLAPAHAPNGIASPKRLLLSAFGSVLGSFFGLACAIVLVGRRTVAYSPDLLDRIPGLPTIGIIGR